MNSDLNLIIKTYPKEQSILRVYAIGDVHVGSPEFNESAIRKKIRIIEEDPFAALVLCGDLGDFGLKNSRSNVYKQLLDPKQQMSYILDLFSPIKDKIAAAVPGNHEERVTREVGTCPMYDLCVLWGIPEVYRENVAITKFSFGCRHGKQQYVFIGVTSHGSSRNKHHKYMGGFDNADFSISAHTHNPEYSPQGRIRIDRQHGTASHVPYKEIVVDAHLKPGGYGMKREYEIPAPPELQYLELSTYRDNDRNRTDRNVINYHAIQL